MELLTAKQVGEILNLSRSTLSKMRSDKYKGRFNIVLPFIKIGRAVRYEREAVNQAIKENVGHNDGNHHTNNVKYTPKHLFLLFI